MRQGDPEQNRADLQLAIILHHLEVGRNDISGREDDEAEAGHQKQDRHKPFSGEQPKIEERPFRDQLAHDEGEREQAARQQKPIDEAVVNPVEAVALIEACVKQSETEPGIDEPRPVKVA